MTDTTKQDFADAWRLLQRTQQLLSGTGPTLGEMGDLKRDIDAFFQRFQSHAN